MSVIYSEPNIITPAVTDNVFVPSYARGSRKKKSVKTWMILAPIGALALLGGGAALMMSGDRPTAPLVEEPATMSAPLSAPVSAPLESSSLPANAAIENPVTPPATVVRTRRVQPAASAPVPVVREQAPVTSEEPMAYSSAPSGTTAAPPAPSIAVAPLN